MSTPVANDRNELVQSVTSGWPEASGVRLLYGCRCRQALLRRVPARRMRPFDRGRPPARGLERTCVRSTASLRVAPFLNYCTRNLPPKATLGAILATVCAGRTFGGRLLKPVKDGLVDTAHPCGGPVCTICPYEISVRQGLFCASSATEAACARKAPRPHGHASPRDRCRCNGLSRLSMDNRKVYSSRVVVTVISQAAVVDRSIANKPR